MSQGLRRLLDRVIDDPTSGLLDRFLSLVKDLPDEGDKVDLSLALASGVIDRDPDLSLRMAHMVFQFDQDNTNALDIMIEILRSRGRFAKAAVLANVRKQVADRVAQSRTGATDVERVIGDEVPPMDMNLMKYDPPPTPAKQSPPQAVIPIETPQLTALSHVDSSPELRNDNDTNDTSDTNDAEDEKTQIVPARNNRLGFELQSLSRPLEDQTGGFIPDTKPPAIPKTPMQRPNDKARPVKQVRASETVVNAKHDENKTTVSPAAPPLSKTVAPATPPPSKTVAPTSLSLSQTAPSGKKKRRRWFRKDPDNPPAPSPPLFISKKRGDPVRESASRPSASAPSRPSAPADSQHEPAQDSTNPDPSRHPSTRHQSSPSIPSTPADLSEAGQWNLLNDLWQSGRISEVRALLEKSDAPYKSARVWGLYLDSLVHEGQYHSALTNMRATLAQHQDDALWGEAAYMRMTKVWRARRLQGFKWQPQDGMASLLEKMQHRARPTLAGSALL